MALRSALVIAAAVLGLIIVGILSFVLLRDGDDEQAAAATTPAETGQAPATQAPAGQTAESSTPTPPLLGTPRPAPSPPAEGAFGFGQPADEDTIAAIDIDVPPDGSGLPEGSGTPEEGAEVYAAECASCHGQTGTEGGLGPALVSEPGPWREGMPRTIGSWWPYATTVYDYVYRAMPFDEPGSLEPDQVYAVTAYLLRENTIIEDGQEMNAETLPQVQMPNQPSFVPCWPEDCRFEGERGS